jgi:hypothetical protein
VQAVGADHEVEPAPRDWSAEDRSTFYRLLARFADDLAAHFVEN